MYNTPEYKNWEKKSNQLVKLVAKCTKIIASAVKNNETDTVMEQVKVLKDEIKQQKEILDNEYMALLQSKAVHNSRGAGRKPSITPLEIQAIKDDLNSGISREELAYKYGKSYSTIQRIVKK